MPRKPASKTFQPLPYELNIGMAANDAYLVRVGCETHVFNSPADLLEALSEYLVNPKRALERHRKALDARQTITSELSRAHYNPNQRPVEAAGIPCQGNALQRNY